MKDEDIGEASLAFADERQTRIAEMVAARGKVLTSQMTVLLKVSEPTLRKDLTILEQRGLLKRTHGGAISVRAPHEQDPATRSAVHFEAKQAIAAACAAELQDGDAVFLDSGTTVQLITRELAKSHRQVKVVTNAPDVAKELALSPACNHILLGGSYRAVGGSLTGPLTNQNLELFTINVAVIGVSGITEDGITVSDLAEAQLKKLVVERAQKIIVPVDSSKIGVVDFTRVCGLEKIDLIVTEVSGTILEPLGTAHAIRIVVAQGGSK